MYKNTQIFVCNVSKVQEVVYFGVEWYTVSFIWEEEVGDSPLKALWYMIKMLLGAQWVTCLEF